MPRRTPATVIASAFLTPARSSKVRFPYTGRPATITRRTCFSVDASTDRHGSARVAAEAGQVREPTLDEAADRYSPRPRERVARVGGRKLDQIRRFERACERNPVPSRRDLELAEQVARPRRRPVGAETHAQAAAAGTQHVGGVAVQPEVRERRPHDRSAAARRPCTEVGLGECGRMDPDEAFAHALVPVEEAELLAQLRVDTLGEVVEERDPGLQPGCGLLQLVAGRREHRLEDALTLPELLVLDVAQHPAGEDAGQRRRTLYGGDAADRRLDLREPQRRRPVPRCRAPGPDSRRRARTTPPAATGSACRTPPAGRPTAARCCTRDGCGGR